MFKKIKLASTLLALLTFSTSSVSVYAADKAIIVGVSNYPDSRNNLPGVDIDVQLAKVMAQRLNIVPANIKILEDKQATGKNFRQALQWAAQGVGANDKVMIYVSSHGSQKADKNNDEPDGLDETLYLYDGHFVDDEFGALIKQIPSKNVVIIVDACHSGTVHKSVYSGRSIFNISYGITKFFDSKETPTKTNGTENISNSGFVVEESDSNHVLLAAAQDKQQSIATEKGSLFTRAVFDSFEELRTQENFTWKAIFARASEQITDNKELNAQGRMFNPNLQGNDKLANAVINLGNKISTTNPQSAANKPNWQGLMDITKRGTSFNVNIKPELKVGEVVPIEFVAPIDGYLNIVTVDVNDKADVLFPNRFSSNQQVKAGQKFDIYQNMTKKIKSKKPLGKTLLFLVISKERADFSELGVGKYTNKGEIDSKTAFARITPQDIKLFLDKGAGIDENDDVKPAPSNSDKDYYIATAIFNTIE